MGGKEVGRERETRAGGQVRQQELRGASHYDSSSFFMAPGLDYNLKAAGQSKRPGKAWKTAVSQDAIRDGGLEARWGGGGGWRDVPRTQTRQCEVKVTENEQIGFLFAWDTNPLHGTNQIFLFPDNTAARGK